ncbi:hypothetical protein [uncultured Kordia sp.]|uniref:hypothetical protein n=1 Tax=uncultured Kordia sp. TaxID=507699 RepID=UPI002622FE23|nr:hypothetical protein [uncultured Kordia sp.]
MRSFFKTSCLSVAMLLFVSNMYSQQTITLKRNNTPTLTFFLVPHFNPLFGLGYVNPNKSLIEVAEGSQYFDEEFSPVIGVDSTETEVKARYNAFLDEMEVQSEEKQGWINKSRLRDKIVFTENGAIYKILDGDDREDKSLLGYYEVLLESDYVSLYKKNAKTLAVGLESTPYMTPAPEIVTEFQPMKTVYYVEFNGSGNVQKLPRTRRGVAKLFGDKRDVVKAFMKENKLRVTKDQDLKAIITYVNLL